MDARQEIYEILAQIPGQKKMAGGTMMIQCPFHGDRTPSCGVNLVQDAEIPLGFFNCFGCPEKGPWNKLAKELGAKEFKDWELGFNGNGSTREQQRRKNSLTYVADRINNALRTGAMIPWPKNSKWRGYDGTLIRKMGGLAYDDQMNGEIMLFFPIEIGNQFRGGVSAFMEKQVNGKSYINTKGKWAQSDGLLGYQYMKTVLRKHPYSCIVIVEGPRDVLRLLEHNIPALAILGIENFSEKKVLKIMALCSKINTFYVMPDNDKAGSEMYKTVKHIASDYVKVKHLKLPKDKDEEGKLIKMDPDDAPESIIKEVKKLVEKHRVKRVT